MTGENAREMVERLRTLGQREYDIGREVTMMRTRDVEALCENCAADLECAAADKEVGSVSLNDPKAIRAATDRQHASMVRKRTALARLVEMGVVHD